MKNIKWLSGAFIMALGLLVFGACSDDDEKAKPTFPEKAAIDCAAGEVKTLTFHAENAWTLASSRLWCKFKDGNDIVTSLSGGPGEQTVTVTVTEDAWGFEDAVAEILMGMEGQAQAIAVVNRAAKGYKAEAYKMVGQNKVIYDASNPAVVPYFGEIKLEFDANFDWKLANCPEWLKVSSKVGYISEERTMMGDAGQVTSWLLEFKSTAEYSKGPERNTTLKFVDSNGALRLEVPLNYVGIADNKVEFSIKAFGWMFSADASEYWADGGLNGTPGEKKPAPMTFSAITKSGFKVAYLERDKNYVYTLFEGESDSWFSADVDGDQIAIYPTLNAGKKRIGALVVVPNKVFTDELKSDFKNLLESDGIFKYTFEQYIFEFSQEGQISDGFFDVKNGMTYESLNDRLMDKSADYGPILNTTIVYELKLDVNESYNSIMVTPISLNPNWQIAYEELWENVEVEPTFGGAFSIYSISAGEKVGQMIFKVMNGESVHAALIVSQYQ